MKAFLCIFSVLLMASAVGLPTRAAALEAKAYCTEQEKSEYIPVAQRLTSVSTLLTLYSCATEKPSHIFGTLHTDNHTIIKNAQQAFDTLTHSDAAFFEIVSDKKSNLDVISHIVLPQNSPENLESLLGTPLFLQVKSLAQEFHAGFPDMILQRYRPWASTILMEYPEPVGDGVVLDEFLQAHARKHNVPLHSLENVAEQFSTFESLTPQQEKMLVSDTVSHIKAIRILNDSLEQAYLISDMQALQHIGNQSFFEIQDAQLRAIMTNGIIAHRNETMTAKILPEIRKGNRFIGVGVLHLIGKDGILERLEREGYAVF